MIDGYALVSILLRLVAVVLITGVLYRQIRLLRPKSRLQWLKRLLILLVSIMLFNGLFTIMTNFFRQDDGNLKVTIRHISSVLNATSSVCSALILSIIYRKRKDDE
jgi:heme A synthase